MKVQVRLRSMAFFALAISLLALAGMPQVAGAESKKADAPGQVKKAESAPAGDDTPSAGTPTAADNPEGFSAHDADNGPGGQVCDGDPDNAPGAGGNYENTCPAGPSQNGAGNGNANGKPCAGCVGNADDKNPKGQADSGPSDHNNGYECDQKGRSAKEGNNGIGFGNPAHTGCQTVEVSPCVPGVDAACTPPPTCPDGKAMPASGKVEDCNPPKAPTCPNGNAMPASGKVEDCNPVTVQGTPTVVLGEVLARPVEVLGVQLQAPEVAPAVAPAALARTGASFGPVVRAGLLLAAIGLALTGLATRRRRSGVGPDLG